MTTVNQARSPAPAEYSIVAVPPPADPAPLGLAGFALTTFLLSASNAGWMKGSGAEWLGYAFAYGGLCQLLAGMWEFRNRNVFGATAFSTYGGFWIGLGLFVILVAPGDKTPAMLHNDEGWILLGFAIINTYLLLWSTFVNAAVFGVFLTLEVTEILLVIANFTGSTGLTKAGGYVGVLTAIVAWFTSSAGIINGMTNRVLVPVGAPFFTGSRAGVGHERDL
ncbi:MAG TPA: acetate uptake transporter [Acidimicrobiales bacterium]|nr:acetate uptake transporter [Acidimicrobiales bacterium]